VLDSLSLSLSLSLSVCNELFHNESVSSRLGDMTRYPNLLSALLLVVGLSFLALLWAISKDSEEKQLRSETEVTGEQVQLRLAACVQSRVDLVNTLANVDWQSSEQLRSRWITQVAIVYSILPGIQALNFVDTDWKIQRVYPVEPNLNALGKSLRENPNPSVLASLPLAEASNSIVRTDIIDLLQSGKGFVLYKKILGSGGDNLGYVNGVFRVSDLMETCLAEENLKRNFRFVVAEQDGQSVYSRADVAPPWPGQITVQIDVADRPWDLVFAPTEYLLDSQRNRVTDFLILIGSLLVLVLVLAIVFRSTLRHQITLRENQETYRLLVENQTDMVVKVNMDGEFMYVSPSYCEEFGKSEGELLGHQFLPLVHEDDREATSESLDSLSQPPHESYHEQRAMTKRGWRWIAWSNKGVVSSTGQLEAITAVGRDVTDIRALEERMAHADKMKALGEMAGGISHDFNNLLQVMLGNVEFLIDQPKRVSEQTPLLFKVRSAVERAMQLTEKISGLSQQQTAKREVIDLNVLVSDVVELLSRTISETISLNLQTSEAPSLIRADPTQIEQVILNLCFNARDAIETKGTITLKVDPIDLDAEFCRAHPGVLPGRFVRLRIVDSGKGIHESEIGRVFDPFFTTKAPGAGTGLGLANCYTIVERYKGMITADSWLGEGSNFTVFLPALSMDTIGELAEHRRENIDQEQSDARLILVADDNLEVRDLACLQLEQAGYQTIKASNGLEAVEQFRAHKDEIGLVILDIVMPVLDGPSAGKNILEIAPEQPLLFISGYSPEMVENSELPGPLLKKPFKGEDLKRMVKLSLHA
jgi:PAS domain S-box-containing protein